ncbi:Asp23/Gls24 family envelope stress response protein [Kribbella qitaiheensis]|uniref:Asp23/Gls24 family envelope stress response protein n=1 Tax=Kribbella qitaiheensis TaxID=1544730 RepID=A0A7G6WSA8_9ACTN|nr:Asp23/Gls24 family envelope stress response protein [Kribbella qitaiheensis]QNE16873.1 Asp23/Gls24 family envelope stress response protein [Kribbella qitaiheensis]
MSAGSLLPPGLRAEIRAAEGAAGAARAVPGVVRLQPGVWGLLRQFATQAWTQATGKPLPDIGGVDADLTAEQLRIDLRVVVSIFYRAADVGEAVHDAVMAAVAPMTDRPLQVRVHIVEIDLEPGG